LRGGKSAKTTAPKSNPTAHSFSKKAKYLPQGKAARGRFILTASVGCVNPVGGGATTAPRSSFVPQLWQYTRVGSLSYPQLAQRMPIKFSAYFEAAAPELEPVDAPPPEGLDGVLEAEELAGADFSAGFVSFFSPPPLSFFAACL